MLSFVNKPIMLSVIKLSVVMLSFIILSVVMISVIKSLLCCHKKAIMLSVVMLSFVILSVVMPSVIKSSLSLCCHKITLYWVSLCSVSLCWVLLCWRSWRHKNTIFHLLILRHSYKVFCVIELVTYLLSHLTCDLDFVTWLLWLKILWLPNVSYKLKI